MEKFAVYIAINKSCARKEILFCLASIACSACQKRVGENVISAFIQPFVLPQRHRNHPDHLSQIGENVPSQVCVMSSETGHLPNVWAAGRVGHSVGRGSLDGSLDPHVKVSLSKTLDPLAMNTWHHVLVMTAAIAV